MTLTLHDTCVKKQGNQNNSFSAYTSNSTTKASQGVAFDKIYSLYNLTSCRCDRGVLLKHKTHHAVLRCTEHLKYIGFVSKDLKSKYFCYETQENITQDVVDRIAELNRLEGYSVNQPSLFDGEDL